jgi:hypothetical protein
VRWLQIPEVISNIDREALQTITAVVFLGVGDVKHQCRPATDDELQREETESAADNTDEPDLCAPKKKPLQAIINIRAVVRALVSSA